MASRRYIVNPGTSHGTYRGEFHGLLGAKFDHEGARLTGTLGIDPSSEAGIRGSLAAEFPPLRAGRDTLSLRRATGLTEPHKLFIRPLAMSDGELRVKFGFRVPYEEDVVELEGFSVDDTRLAFSITLRTTTRLLPEKDRGTLVMTQMGPLEISLSVEAETARASRIDSPVRRKAKPRTKPPPRKARIP